MTRYELQLPPTDNFFQGMLGRKPITQWTLKWPWLKGILDTYSQVRFCGGTGNQYVLLYLLHNAYVTLKCNSCYVYNTIIWISVIKGIMNSKKLFLQSFKEYTDAGDNGSLLAKADLGVVIGGSASRIFQSFVQDARETESIAVRKLLYKQMQASDPNQSKFVFRNARTKQTARKGSKKCPRKQQATHAARTTKAKFLQQPKIQCANQHKKKSVSKKISMKNMQHIRIKKKNVKNAPSLSGDIVSSNNKKYGRGVRKSKRKSRGGDGTLQFEL